MIIDVILSHMGSVVTHGYFGAVSNDDTKEYGYYIVRFTTVQVPSQDVPFFYTPSHLSELKSCKSIISTDFPFIFIFK